MARLGKTCRNCKAQRTAVSATAYNKVGCVAPRPAPWTLKRLGGQFIPRPASPGTRCNDGKSAIARFRDNGLLQGMAPCFLPSPRPLPPILPDYWQRNTENIVYKFSGPLSLAYCFHATLAQAAPWLGKDGRQAFTALQAKSTLTSHLRLTCSAHSQQGAEDNPERTSDSDRRSA